MGKILGISLKLNLRPNTLGCYGLTPGSPLLARLLNHEKVDSGEGWFLWIVFLCCQIVHWIHRAALGRQTSCRLRRVRRGGVRPRLGQLRPGQLRPGSRPRAPLSPCTRARSASWARAAPRHGLPAQRPARARAARAPCSSRRRPTRRTPWGRTTSTTTARASSSNTSATPSRYSAIHRWDQPPAAPRPSLHASDKLGYQSSLAIPKRSNGAYSNLDSLNLNKLNLT